MNPAKAANLELVQAIAHHAATPAQHRSAIVLGLALRRTDTDGTSIMPVNMDALGKALIDASTEMLTKGAPRVPPELVGDVIYGRALRNILTHLMGEAASAEATAAIVARLRGGATR